MRNSFIPSIQLSPRLFFYTVGKSPALLASAVRPWADAFKTKAEEDGGRASLTLGSCKGVHSPHHLHWILHPGATCVLLVLKRYVWMNGSYEGSVNVSI